MFTSEPSLVQRIERLISETPIVDPHTHLRCDQPNAPDLAGLLSDPGIRTELRAVGMPAADFDDALPPEERVRRSIPYVRRMRNTGAAWCLFRILRDLYDFHDPQLTESNYLDLCGKVAATGQDPSWTRQVLRDRCNIQTAVTGLGNRSGDAAEAPEGFLYALDAHSLFRPAPAAERTKTGEYYETLSGLFGDRPARAERLARSVRDWLSRTVTGPVRFVNAFLPIEQRFTAPDLSQTESALTRAAGARSLTDLDVDALARFVTWEILGWHHDHGKTIQLIVGSECPNRDGRAIPRFQETWTAEMARAFQHFGNARFALLTTSDLLGQECTALAREFPNVSLSGHGSRNVSPGSIETAVGRRVQSIPMSKFCGFFSGAQYAEWVYGKYLLTRKATASALARLVDVGYYDADELPPILHQIFHDTPRDLFNLAGA